MGFLDSVGFVIHLEDIYAALEKLHQSTEKRTFFDEFMLKIIFI